MEAGSRALCLCLWFSELVRPALVAWVTLAPADGQLAVAMLMRIFQRCQGCLSSTCVLFICRVMLQGHEQARTFYWKCDAINNLWDDAVSNGISHSRCCPFSTFPLLSLPVICSYFIIYISSHIYFGAVYQFNQPAHREEEEALVGSGEGRREGPQSASSPHPHSNASLLGSHHQPRRQVSAITVN